NGEPGARVILQRQVQQPGGFRATIDRAHAQAIPLDAVDHDFRHERRHLEPLVRQRHRRGWEGRRLRVAIDRGNTYRILRPSTTTTTEYPHAAARAVEQAQPQATWVDALGDDEALFSGECQCEGDLTGGERFDARPGHDIGATGKWRNLRRSLAE